jgi:hypothetical protein
MQVPARAPFEGVVRNHLARRSQRQNVTSIADSSRPAVLVPWLQSQHKHLKNAEPQPFVSFLAQSIVVTVHRYIVSYEYLDTIVRCRKQRNGSRWLICVSYAFVSVAESFLAGIETNRVLDDL